MSKRQYIGFAALEVCFWCFHACFICYASAYFLDSGISNTVVSLLLSGYMLCSFVGALVFGSLCDALGTNKKVFLPGVIAAATVALVCYINGANAAVLAVAYPLLGFFFVPQSANADAWLLSACHHDQKIYGRIRSAPSFVYAFIAVLMGKWIQAQGYRVMLLGAFFFLFGMVAAALFLPDSGRRGEKQKITRNEYVSLFYNQKYRQLIILLFLAGLAFAPVTNLKIIFFERVGGNVTHVGFDSFACAMTQVPFFLLAGSLSRIPLRTRYAAMTALPVLMILLCMMATSPVMVIAGSVVFNAGYGIMVPTMREVTEKYVPEKLRNLGHNLSDSVLNSFSAVISLSYAGVIVDGFGVQTLLVLCALISLAAFAVSLFGKMEKNADA